MNDLLKSYFGITPIEILKLNGYENTNYLIKTLDNKPFEYGKEDYANPSILMRRAQNLND